MEIISVDQRVDTSYGITAAIDVLSKGGVVVFPTDTLYGLAANALDKRAVERVFNIKHRSLSKALPMVVRDIRWVRELANVTPKQEPILEKIWPGAVTVVLEKKSIVPDVLTANEKTVAIRIPNYPLVDELLAKFGYPLTMTSANISGEESSQRIEDIVAAFRGQDYQPDLIIDVGTLPPSEPSTLLDLTGDQPKILRVGAAKPQQLMEILQP